PGGTVEEHQIIRPALLTGNPGPIQTVIAHPRRQPVTQSLGKELAYPLHRMLITRHGDTLVVETAGQGFPGGAPVQTGYRDFQPQGENGTLEQPLSIDDQIIAVLVQTLAETLPLAAAQGLQGALAPAPDGHRNNLRHRRMPNRDFRKAFLHHPVEADPRY